MPDDSTQVLVDRDDLLAVLAAVPSWVPEGAPGDDRWTERSLNAKRRLESEVHVPRHLRYCAIPANPDERADRYRVALLTFGRHGEGCARMTQRVRLVAWYFGRVPEVACTCGFEAIQREALEAR